MISVRAVGLLVGLPLLLSGCSTVPVGVVGLTLRDGRPVVLVHACNEQVTGAVLLDDQDVVLAARRVYDPGDGSWDLPVDLLPPTGARIAPLYGKEMVGPAMPVAADDLARLRRGVVRFSDTVDPRPDATATVEDDEDGFHERACAAAKLFHGQPGITPTTRSQSPSSAR